MITREDLLTRQNYDLDLKVRISKRTIREWYEEYNGKVYVSFSGGKDSTVLLHLVRSQYPEVPAVFADTGLEYPEIRQFVKETENVIWVKPKIRFDEVIKKYGYPVVSKVNARFIRDLQNPTEKNKAVRKLRLTGINRAGKILPSMKLARKWRYLVDAPFKVSEQCCQIMKKNPMHNYVKETQRKPITGLMATDSLRRAQMYLRYGCNAFDFKEPVSNPLGFWRERDIWDYIKREDLAYSKIYDIGEARTGCMFCMFGVHLEKEPNRFQRRKKSHPKQWEYCIYKLNLKEPLDYMKIPY